MIKTAILTISDVRTIETDLSGPAIRNIMRASEFEICAYDVIEDNRELIKEKLIHYCDKLKVNLLLTTGGTGFSPRDITPEVTLEVICRQAPGIAEHIRREGLKNMPKLMLCRAVSGIRDKTLIINLPGNPKAAEDSLRSILEIIPHAIVTLCGNKH
jgi:molybdenum cofactor synthesis domain-containing protein